MNTAKQVPSLWRPAALACLAWLASATAPIDAPVETSLEGLELFEKQIRPVLVEHCFKCHSATSEKLKGNLRLDSREDMLKGGGTRPAVVPGDPEKSLLVEAIRYSNPDLQMPPKHRLADEQITSFVEWIRLGAIWPAEAPEKQIVQTGVFDLAQRRRQHWAWHPIQPTRPSPVKDSGWVRNPVDQFLLAMLEKSGSWPARAADKQTLIRRLYYDLLGLPPPRREVEAFLQDQSPGAYENLADRLLSSPHFGERWARHWLDLVRYAETLGHEFDYPIHNAWRYRDYVIRAFNADVPYDQFVTEQISGDLISLPRLHPTEGFNESCIGTAFFWFGQQTHSPVDVRQHQADVIENQIDVLTKTFLGLTVACARCHDHKFDAISTRDYYALYGVFASSRYAQRAIEPAESAAEIIQRLRQLKIEIRNTFSDVWTDPIKTVAQYLLAERAMQTSPPVSCEQIAGEFRVDADRLSRWVQALQQASTSAEGHPLQIWKRFTASGYPANPKACEEQWSALLAESKLVTGTDPSSSHAFAVFADFRSQDYSGWCPDGEGFGHKPSPVGEWIVGDTNRPVAAILQEPSAHSGAVSLRLQGALRSPTFAITNRFLHLFVSGRDARINVFIDNFALIQSPIYGSLRQVLNHDDFRWLTIDLSMWMGHRAYVELSDIATPDLAGGGKTEGYSPRGFAAVSRILLSEDKSPPKEPTFNAALTLLGDAPIDRIETLAQRYQQAVVEAVQAWTSGTSLNSDKARTQIALLNWLIQNRLLEAVDLVGVAKSSARLGKLLSEFHQLESVLPAPERVPGMADGTGLDERVFIRGSAKNFGEAVPRRFLEAIAGPDQPSFEQGSGRLELARRITDPSNPFLARVMANRVWHHLFGRGLVPTPDDFGLLGQPPTHPELLDWLAVYFRDEARWSMKKLIRLLVTSSAYRMSSKISDAAIEEKDPDNALLHRRSIRRLEGEAIRDALLAVSGRLERVMFGSSVPVHLNEFMDGRGRPSKSGPLDGAGRRSIYLEVRRNFLSPMMRTFDAPVPFTTVGKRTISNVPAQSLILMNDPFVVEQARAWARRLLRDPNQTPEALIKEVYYTAFSRPPSPGELSGAFDFLGRQTEFYASNGSSSDGRERAWADLCHVIFNAKEFIFIE
ncbi:MAG: PSD1 domain-containing protein [Verrucomicrobia bacterium]|nr:PSD1 domain-containing protein [Verrucomicrobiota bacterium]